MTEYRIGDRVRIEFEGTVADTRAGDIYVTPANAPDQHRDNNYEVWMHRALLDENVTRLPPELPTVRGSVIRVLTWHGYPVDGYAMRRKKGWQYSDRDELTYGAGLFDWYVERGLMTFEIVHIPEIEA